MADIKKKSSQGVGVHRDTKLLIKTEEYQFFQRVKTITIRRVSPRHLDHATIRPLEEKCVHNEGVSYKGKYAICPVAARVRELMLRTNVGPVTLVREEIDTGGFVIVCGSSTARSV